MSLCLAPKVKVMLPTHPLLLCCSSRGGSASLPPPGPFCHPRDNTPPNGGPLQPSGVRSHLPCNMLPNDVEQGSFIILRTAVTCLRTAVAASPANCWPTKPLMTTNPLVWSSLFNLRFCNPAFEYKIRSCELEPDLGLCEILL